MNKFYKTLFALSFWLLAFGTMQAQIITTVAGNGTAGYSGDGGSGTAAEFTYINKIAIDLFGNIFIADAGNNRIRKVNTLGIVNTVAGSGTPPNNYGYSGDGGQATNAELYNPTGIAFDGIGDLFIADFNNNVIRKVNVSTGIITTIAGTSIAGYSGDGGQASNSELTGPRQIAFDALGNLFIADMANNVIRKVNLSTGIITTVVGNGTAGYSGDGGVATMAEIYSPEGLCFDKLNNLYLSDDGNNVIRKVNTSTGIITTIAGNGTAGYFGDGSPATAAQLYGPQDIIADSLGNLYFSEDANNIIRKINTAGIISTVAGNGYGAGTFTGGYSGDGGLAINAELFEPGGVALYTNTLYIADYGNNRIRKVSNVGQMGVQQYAVSREQLSVYPNPVSNNLQVSFSGTIAANEITVSDMLGNIVTRVSVNSNQLSINVTDLSEGVYFLRIETNEGTEIKKIIKQ